MSKGEFLQGLQDALSGMVPPAVVQENLRYYEDYIRTEVKNGRRESEVMEELGDPRLIARTIIDTTPGSGEESYEAYTAPFGGARQEERERERERTSGRSGSTIRYYDLNKWYWKLLGILIVVGIFSLVITVVGGILSLVIPLLPVIGLAAVIMWFVRGPRR